MALERNESESSLRASNLSGHFRNLARLAVQDNDSKQYRSSITGHHTLITKTGRLKLLHRSQAEVEKSWEQTEQFGTRDISDPVPHITLEPVAKQYNKREERRAPARDVDASAMIEFDVKEVCLDENCVDDVTLALRRKGDLSNKVKCSWKILNGSMDPKVFRDIEHRCGNVDFEPGQDAVLMKVRPQCDPTWNVDAFYVVELSSCESDDKAAHIMLGKNSQVRIYSLNSDTFPAGVKPGAGVDAFIFGFFAHNYSELPRRSIKGIAFAIMAGVIYYCQAQLARTVTNCVSDTEAGCVYHIFGLRIDFNSSNATLPMVILAGFTCLCAALDLLRGVFHRHLRLGGRATKMLRANLFTTMLTFSDGAKLNYDAGDVPKIIDTDVAVAIDGVWCNLFVVVENCSKLVFQYILTMEVCFGLSDSLASSVLLCAPVMMLVMMIVAHRITHQGSFRRQQTLRDKEENWHAFVHMSEECRTVINSNLQTDPTIVSVDKMHAEINKANIAKVDYEATQMWILKSSFILIALAVLVVMGGIARSGGMNVGTFLMLYKTVNDVGKAFLVLAEKFKVMASSAAAIKKIAEVLNAVTARRERYTLNRARLRERVDSDVESNALVLDKVSFVYPPSLGRPAVRAIYPMVATIEPDKLTCLTRQFGGGIDTLFRLIAGQIIPTSGYVRFPVRWNIIYVPAVPILFDGTLMYNLAYSDIQMGKEINQEVIWHAAKELGMSEHLIYNQDFDVGTGGEHMKLSDRLCVSLIRALTFDVECVLVSSILDILGEERGKKIIGLLKKYIDNRGLPGKAHRLPFQFRHRKMAIYTSRIQSLQDQCDVLLESSQPEADGEYGDSKPLGSVIL